MKRSSLTFALILGLAVLVNNSCRNNSPIIPAANTNGIITGDDQRKCGCCGGFMITFSADPRPYVADYKLITNSLDLPITPADTFPLNVKVDWKPDPNSICGSIIVTKFERR